MVLSFNSFYHSILPFLFLNVVGQAFDLHRDLAVLAKRGVDEARGAPVPLLEALVGAIPLSFNHPFYLSLSTTSVIRIKDSIDLFPLFRREGKTRWTHSD